MSAIDDLSELLVTTEVMKQAFKSLREVPANLLNDICREYEKMKQPVPDYRILPMGYMGETSLKALISAGLVNRISGGLLAYYCYEPTEKGLKYWEKLKKEGFYTRRQSAEVK